MFRLQQAAIIRAYVLENNKSCSGISGIITLKISEWSKIITIPRIHRGCTTMYSRYCNNFRPLTYFQINYTRCCTNTIFLLRMSTQLLETCRRFKYTYRRRNCASSWLPTRIKVSIVIVITRVTLVTMVTVGM